MRSILTTCLTFCLLALAASGAIAKPDVEDEDLSYLANFNEPRYGYDKAFHKQCVQEGRGRAQTPEKVGELSVACRAKATPRKCRSVTAELPPTIIAATAATRSPQQLCADACADAAKGSREATECALN